MVRIGGLMQRSRFHWQRMRYRTIAPLLRWRYPTGREAEVRVNGYRLRILLNTSIGNQLYIHGTFEPRETKVLRAIVEPHHVVLDVGANIGYFTLLLASLTVNGRVIAFEPIPENAQLIERSVAANRCENVTVHRLALSDCTGEASFCVSEDGAFSSLIDTHRVKAKVSIPVTTQTLDEYLAGKHTEEIGLIKIDVEGAESLVIEGADRTLMSERVRCLMVEMNEPNLRTYNTTQAQVDARLRGYGYEGWCFEGMALRPFFAGRGGRSPNVFYFRLDAAKKLLSRLAECGIPHEEDHTGNAHT